MIPDDFCCPICDCPLTWMYAGDDEYGTIREAICPNCGWDENNEKIKND